MLLKVKNLLQVQIMAIKSKKNFLAKNLFSPKYKMRIVKPKKGKGSYSRKKKNQSLAPIC